MPAGTLPLAWQIEDAGVLATHRHALAWVRIRSGAGALLCLFVPRYSFAWHGVRRVLTGVDPCAISGLLDSGPFFLNAGKSMSDLVDTASLFYACM